MDLHYLIFLYVNKIINRNRLWAELERLGSTTFFQMENASWRLPLQKAKHSAS